MLSSDPVILLFIELKGLKLLNVDNMDPSKSKSSKSNVAISVISSFKSHL